MAFDKAVAALTIFCEASGEPMEGKIAVAATLFNRLKTGRFGKTIAAVCLQRYQYSEWNADRADNLNLLRGAETPDGDAIMHACMDAFDMAQSGVDPSLGATHYFSVSIPAPAWAAQGVQTVQIGHHIFFRNVP